MKTESDDGARAADLIAESWAENAAAGTRIVRNGLIPSRKVGTDAAIVDACAAHGAGSLLDVGCGEGWLGRELAVREFAVAFPAAMPWYYRTLASWVEQLTLAGLRIVRLDEPLHPSTNLPLSLLLHCEVA